MNLNTFLRELSKIKGWRLDGYGCIRRGCQCPITALVLRKHKKRMWNHQFSKAGRMLGLSYEALESIVYAADSDLFPEFKALRKRLLKACKLKES